MRFLTIWQEFDQAFELFLNMKQKYDLHEKEQMAVMVLKKIRLEQVAENSKFVVLQCSWVCLLNKAICLLFFLKPILSCKTKLPDPLCAGEILVHVLY